MRAQNKRNFEAYEELVDVVVVVVVAEDAFCCMPVGVVAVVVVVADDDADDCEAGVDEVLVVASVAACFAIASSMFEWLMIIDAFFAFST